MLMNGRLTLRLLEAEDADWIARGISLPALLRRFVPPSCSRRREKAVDFPDRFAFVPRFPALLHDGDPLGLVSLAGAKPADARSTRTSELGCWLTPIARARGLATAAARTLTGARFDQPDDDKVITGWISGKDSSERALRDDGFTPADTVDFPPSGCHGRMVPVERVRLTRDRWLRNVASPAS